MAGPAGQLRQPAHRLGIEAGVGFDLGQQAPGRLPVRLIPLLQAIIDFGFDQQLGADGLDFAAGQQGVQQLHRRKLEEGLGVGEAVQGDRQVM